ncbi:MAG: TIGR03067 domain-containing protein [Gemmataceae bacterium]
MRKVILANLAALLVLNPLVAAPAPDGDLDKIQGTWKVESVESGGRTLVEPYKDWTFNIKDDKLTIKVGDKIRSEYTIKIDPDKKPKTIDLTRKVGDQTLTELGIYELDGDTWKVCNDEGGDMRPSEYSTKERTGLELIMMKRVK